MKIKNFNLKNSTIYKTIFVLCMIFLCLLLSLNWLGINYFLNGFEKCFKEDFQLYCLDVGQASANLIITPDKQAIVVDTGDGEGNFIEKVEYILDKNHIKEILLLILTHPDADHVGGTADLLNKYQVNNILRPKAYSRLEENVRNYNYINTITYQKAIESIKNEPFCQKFFVDTMQINYGGMEFDIYAADKDKYSDSNSYSPYIYIEYKEKSFLLTGDAPFTRENELMQKFDGLDIDCLFVAHHGSRYSTSKEFLNFLTPETAVISAGDFQHPSDEVIERLRQSSVEDIYVTKDDGDIFLTASDEVLVRCADAFLDLPLVVTLIFCVTFFVINTEIFENNTQKLFKSIRNE